MGKNITFLILALIALNLLSACTPSSNTLPPASTESPKLSALPSSSTPLSTSTEPVIDYSSLLRTLYNTSGVSIRLGEERKEDFFSVKTRFIYVNENAVQVLEYDTPKAMETESKTISPDGSMIRFKTNDNTTTVANLDYISLPHFYKSVRLIVLYVGEDKTITSLLETLLGKQFAGL
jgi:hypothetical protein